MATKKLTRKVVRRSQRITRRSALTRRGAPTIMEAKVLAKEILARMLDLNQFQRIVTLLASRLSIVCMDPKYGIDDVPTLSKWRKDVVAWKNHDVVAHTIRWVGACPLDKFDEVNGVTLNPGQNTGPYGLKADIPSEKYSYELDPPIMVPGGPGEPGLIVED